ncbi:MAG: hydantoinase/oxoprolinase family protein, partial [Alphaproteobacteria bacterium]
MTATWQVGVDVGGTFTDIVAVNPADNSLRTAKVRTEPSELIASLDHALAAVDLTWASVADLMHGTTMVTNAIVEGRLAPVALVATAGFGDILAIGRQNRSDLYRLDQPPKLPPLVPEERRFEVNERIDATGAVVVPLTAEAVDTVVRKVVASGVEAVAVALLNAYANPAHEIQLGECLAEVVPHVTLSHRVNREVREFERTSAAALNAALMPATSGYLDRLRERADNGARLHLFHSAGGMASPDAVRERPLALALSGPAAGVAAAGRVAGQLGLDRVISFDMGGTTTDVCLIIEGTAQISGDRLLAGRPMRQPMVAVESIGAGGGSIASAVAGAIRVGPESAGAEPGPACY